MVNLFLLQFFYAAGMEIPPQICDKNQICVDTSDAFSSTQIFGTREEMIRWIIEVGIRNKSNCYYHSFKYSETSKRWRSNKLIIGCDKGENTRIY